MNIVVQMGYVRSTKNTHLYQCQDQSSPLPTLYIQKHAMETAVKCITVIVEDGTQNNACGGAK